MGPPSAATISSNTRQVGGMASATHGAAVDSSDWRQDIDSISEQRQQSESKGMSVAEQRQQR
ncbi:hypothetical protein PF005_g15812 [Phytophthora fragariae]|uniref:Uncharacterized protein n=1 Tax=Phytophthora fragariae TaxID=53985 RepID=A0A6A3JVU5_9STRA|nr:hypothetical protein PF003_g11016 [Phytophthora fragariae]KAE8999031.1 hypothetical protein PF011_g14795 [Phytophthora fragariae]KAE9075086.1 hypothetical protein PF010_g24448 [Phytophthora fragariae]KAE9096576.1 hypothetical protein PF007_g16945 [Phytophthora fragariae]KAE9134837.1 hypothetical protein PF006_g14742 [Phytophthora fragariae]